jgi:single-strand DNA-binding protein
MAVNDVAEDDTLFLNIVIFGKMAESLAPNLTKGKLVGVSGTLKQEKYEKDGQERTSLSVVANSVQLGPKKAED